MSSARTQEVKLAEFSNHTLAAPSALAPTVMAGHRVPLSISSILVLILEKMKEAGGEVLKLLVCFFLRRTEASLFNDFPVFALPRQNVVPIHCIHSDEDIEVSIARLRKDGARIVVPQRQQNGEVESDSMLEGIVT